MDELGLYDKYDKNLYRLGYNTYKSESELNSVSSSQVDTMVASTTSSVADNKSVSTSNVTAGQNTSTQEIFGIMRSGKATFDNADTGYIIGEDKGLFKLYIGNSTNYFNWTGTQVIISGSITATTGYIGGWTIGASSITDTAGAVGLSSAVTGGDDIRFWAGHVTPASAPFKVTEAGVLTSTSGTIANWTISTSALSTGAYDTLNTLYLGTSGISLSNTFKVSSAGVLTATGAVISGTLTATTGTIGGFTLGATSLSAGTTTTTIKLDTAIGIHLGATLFADAPFSVSLAGDLKSTSGTIGGWTIGATDLSAANGGNTTILSSGATAFSAGPTGSPLVTITQAGVLSATGANISGTITASAGAFGGFTIVSDYIKDTADSFGLASTVTGGNDVRIWAGETYANRATAPFRVYEDGTIVSTGLSVTKLDIPDTVTANSFHVDVDGNAWWGATVLGSAVAKILKTGAATFTTGSIAGWTVNSTSIAKTNIVIDSANDRITVGGTNVILDASGITAIAGTVGGWTLSSTMLKSAATGVRIELNKTDNRISIFDVTNEKVVMGYLSGLPKHDGTGNWGASNYGFWARNGDMLSIDGDSEYTSGDWIVRNDANYLIKDGSANTIIRLGTDTGEKGLFIYDTSATVLAKFISDEIYVGAVGNFLKYTVADGLEIQGTFNIGGTTITIDNTQDVQDALDKVDLAGGGTVYLQNGTYTLTANISIPSGVTLQGVSRDNVIIDCDSSYKVQAIGTNIYETGTVSINNGATTVTGLGTTFTAGMVGRFIMLSGLFYEIATFTSITEIELATTYAGVNISGVATKIATINTAPHIAKLTITNATGTGLLSNYTQEMVVNDIYIYGCGTGFECNNSVFPKLELSSFDNGVNLDMDNAWGWKIDFSDLSNSTTGAGATFNNSGSGTFIDSACTNNTGNGLELSGCSNIAFISCTIEDNGDNGIEFISGCYDIQLIAFTCDGNVNDGITLTATSDRNIIVSSSIINNGGYGINIVASTCDNNQILSPAFDNNTGGTIYNVGTNTQIIPNQYSYIANEDLLAGTPVGISNDHPGYVSKAACWNYYKSISPLALTGYAKPIQITDDTLLIVYEETTTGYLKSVIMQLDLTDYLNPTFGSATTITTTNLSRSTTSATVWDVCKLADGKFAVAYCESGAPTYTRFVAGTVSGTTITLGTAVDYDTSANNVKALTICSTNTDEGVVGITKATSGSGVVAFTTSGTTPTTGALVGLDANFDDDVEITSCKINTSKFIIATDNAGRAHCGTISGTTITLGTVNQYDSNSIISGAGGSSYSFEIISHTNDAFCISYKTTSSSTYGIIAGTVSGTTITAGTFLELTYGTNFHLYPKSSSQLYFSSTNSLIYKVSISGTTLTLGDCIYKGNQNVVGIYSLVNMGSYFIQFISFSGSISYFIEGMATGFIGIIQSDTLKGEYCNILNTGQSGGLSGLKDGGLYTIANGVFTRANESSSTRYLMAISSTSGFIV